MNEYIIYVGRNILGETNNMVEAYTLYAEAKAQADATGLEALLVWEANAEVIEYYDPCYEI